EVRSRRTDSVILYSIGYIDSPHPQSENGHLSSSIKRIEISVINLKTLRDTIFPGTVASKTQRCGVRLRTLRKILRAFNDRTRGASNVSALASKGGFGKARRKGAGALASRNLAETNQLRLQLLFSEPFSYMCH